MIAERNLMTPDSLPSSPDLAPPPPEPAAADRYRAALGKLSGAELVAILQHLSAYDRSLKPGELVGALYEKLGDMRFVESLISHFEPATRMALGLFAITNATAWPLAGLSHAMAALGASIETVIPELRRTGLVVSVRQGESETSWLVAHPIVLTASRTILPEGEVSAASEPVRQLRESDGLEPILRLAALWQRVDEAALRRTQQGTLYKRDRERIEDDPVLVGPITDSLEALPDMGGLWLSLAKGVGLVIDEALSERTIAAPAEYWAENGFHLPQMVATHWLGLRTWHEQGGTQGEAPLASLASPYLRPAALLWLAKMAPDAWLAIEDLANHLEAIAPDWTAVILSPGENPGVPRIDPRSRNGDRRKKTETEPLGGVALLDALLLGPAYQLGLVRAAEEDPGGRRVVQLTALGRYVLGLAPPPPPRPTFEHFLFVQPNFEVIAYRQGLNAAVIGQLSRFMLWTQSGAALEMKLTPESVYRGLEGGMTPEKMLDRLGRHTARPLPHGVAEAVRTWSSRRDRVSYFGSATLIEFVSAEALEQALLLWADDGRAAPSRVADRLLLIEDESTIPFGKFRLAGSRDYRRPPETCVEVEPDGVTLALDLSRSDLFIDTEMARLGHELPDDGRGGAPRRRYRISPQSLRDAIEDGLSPQSLGKWFAQRVGAEMPPAIRLLLHAAAPNPEPPRISRPILLTSPTSDLLDGLLQHPLTRDHLGERLGPTVAIVPEGRLEALGKALATFGLNLESLGIDGV